MLRQRCSIGWTRSRVGPRRLARRLAARTRRHSHVGRHSRHPLAVHPGPFHFRPGAVVGGGEGLPAAGPDHRGPARRLDPNQGSAYHNLLHSLLGDFHGWPADPGHARAAALIAWAAAAVALALVGITGGAEIAGVRAGVPADHRDWLLAVLCGPIGARIASHAHRNPCGWLLLGTGVLAAITLRVVDPDGRADVLAARLDLVAGLRPADPGGAAVPRRPCPVRPLAVDRRRAGSCHRRRHGSAGVAQPACTT